MRSVRRVPLASLPAAVALVLAVAPVVVAGSVSGDANCQPGKSLKITSTAKVEVWHLWTLNAEYFYNPTYQQRPSYTGYEDTWWTISWSVSKQSHSVTCINAG